MTRVLSLLHKVQNILTFTIGLGQELYFLSKMALTIRLAEASTLLKVNTVIMILALLMHLVGFLTVAWTVTHTQVFTFSMGLWTSCMDLIKNLEPLCAKTEIDPSSRWLHVVQVLESMGLATFILGLGVAVMQIFVKRNMFIIYINIALLLCTGVTIEAGCIYFLIKVNFDDFGFSVSLSAAAGLLALLCTMIMIYEAVTYTRRPLTSSQQDKRTGNKGHNYIMAQTNEL